MNRVISVVLSMSLVCVASNAMQLQQDLNTLQTQLQALHNQLGALRPVRIAPTPTPSIPTPKQVRVLPTQPSATTTPEPTVTQKPIKFPKQKLAEVIEVVIPKITIAGIKVLDTGYLQPLERKPVDTPEKKAVKKAEAKGVLNGILAFVKSNKYNPINKNTIKNAIERILAIDPLLISSAAIVLREAGIPMETNYDLMAKLYHKQIKEYVADELDKILKRKVHGPLHKGLRDDIDEALSYPVELGGEIQRAKTIIELQTGTQEALEAQAFITRIEELREWLLNLLKRSKETLKKSEIDVDFYITVFEPEKKRVYHCPAYYEYPADRKPSSYIPLIQDFKDILQDMHDYTTTEATSLKSFKLFKRQNILKKLNGYLDHLTAPKYCPACLKRDIEHIKTENAEGRFDFEGTKRNIKNFLDQIYKKEQDESIKYALETTVPSLESEIQKRGDTPWDTVQNKYSKLISEGVVFEECEYPSSW